MRAAIAVTESLSYAQRIARRRRAGAGILGARLEAAPARAQSVLDAQQIEHLADDVLQQIVDALRPVVEARARRHDRRAETREPQHVLEVDRRQRRLAR